MTETASLVIKVDSSGARKATSDLDNLAKQGTRTSKAVDDLSKRGKMLGVALGGALAIGTVALFKGIISNTIEAEKVQAQLAARIKSTGAAAGLAIGELNAMAGSLQKVTTYGDEAIGSAQAMLLTFTKIGRETFPDALKATLDVATAMGTDLNSAALQVGKALNDPILGLTALSRAGIQFTDDQKGVIKALVETGREADAQKVILQELSTQMGGAASAAADTFGGRITQLKNAFGDLLEGDTGADGIRGTKKAVEDLTATLQSQSTKDGFATVTSALFSLFDVAAKIPAAFALMGKFVGTTLAEMANQADASLTVLKNLGTFGLADGTITGAYAQSNRGAKQYQTALDDMVLANHDLTRQGYTESFKAQFDLGLPGVSKPQLIGKGDAGFNFAADQSARSLANFKPSAANDKPTSSGGGRAKSSRAIPDFMPDTEETKRAIEQVVRARDAFDDMAASLAGPLADAEQHHIRALEEITALGKQGEISSEAIAKAKTDETKRYEEQRAEIEKSLDPMGQLLESMQFELGMIGKSNAERVVTNELRRTGIDLMSEEAKTAIATAKAYEKQAEAKQKSIDLMDDFRQGASNALADIVTGAKSAKDALSDFFDNLAAQITQAIANKWIGQLFGAQGSDGVGTGGGGFLAGIFGALGFASGGYTGQGGVNQPAGIVHKGEVVFSQADIARNGGVGRVESMRRGGGRGNTVININVPRNTSYETAAQTGSAAYAGATRAARRNG